MKKIFDKLVFKFEGYSESGFSYDYQKNYSVTEEAIGHNARCCVTTFLYAYSVGQKKLFKPFLAETEEWGRRGLAKKEIQVQNRCFESQAYALLYWLQHDTDDMQRWKNTVKAYNVWFFEDENPTDYSASKAMEVDLFCEYLQSCIFAQDYERGISVYEHFKGDKLKLTTRSGKLALCYAYLRHFAYGEFTLEQLEKTAHNTLPNRLKECYNHGWFEAGSMWLKTVCHARNHHVKNSTAEQSILTLYEYLTDEEKPDFVAELVAERM